jgi:hypothetical protein
MKLESKYNIGDSIYKIYLNYAPTKSACKKCSGRGHIYCNDGSKMNCECWHGIVCDYTKKITEYTIKGPYTIGYVRIEYNDKKKKMYIDYMCHETGIGSGALYKEEDCYPTKEEAEEKIEELKKGE